ncbi:hypothetical protein AGMMS49579_24250 [Spirochaetia bacterium]|nr:hypothetical protein AGMMS49579_24250 [Spirochaetia bacterium]
MGWLFSYSWRSSEDVLEYFKTMLEQSGYTVHREGHWVFAEGRGTIDLVYVKTASGGRNGWGYKDISVTCGPYVYNAPLWMVKKVHLAFKDNQYYQGWLSHYRQKAAVLKSFTGPQRPELAVYD